VRSLPILLRGTLATLAVLVAMHVAAHPMPASEIFLDLEANGVRAEMHLPLDRLQIAVGPRLQLDAATTTQTMNRREVEKYVSEHFSIVDGDGTPWNARFESAAIVAEDGASELRVRLWLSPRDRSTTHEERRHRRSVRTFRLRSDLIVHQLVTHKIMVFIRRDERRPKATMPESVGRLTYRIHELTMTR
jgi:hypothetical protein